MQINKRGKFVVFEGIDASGKDTQEKILKEYVKNNKDLGEWFFCHVLDEKNNLNNELREVIFNKGERWDKSAEAFLFWADKFQMVQTIKEKLDQGINVLANRWELSSFAYQVYGKQNLALLPIQKVVTSKLDEIANPDIYIIYDISPEESRRRVYERNGAGYNRQDYFEQEKETFFNRVIDGYKKEVENYRHKIIDGTKSREQIFSEVLEEIFGL